MRSERSDHEQAVWVHLYLSEISAVHIAVAKDLLTDIFINAVLRFPGRRSPPTVMARILEDPTYCRCG